MKLTSLLRIVAICALPAAARAQSDTAHHRAVYAQINASEKSLKKVVGTFKDEPTEFALTGWMQDGQLRKIEARCSDDGAGVDEFYLENEKPLFVFSTYTKAGIRVENRLYFKGGAIFKFLTTDKTLGPLHGEDYDSETERLTTNCANFAAALKGKKAGAVPKVTEGVFTGIEEGDYLHWNMRGNGGESLSFFVLNPDASVDKVISNPTAFAGRRCRVTWKKTLEDIPEAGGKMEINQVVGVEWLAKK